MKSEVFEAGEWLMTEGGMASYLYRLKKGKVSIYAEGEKINSVEVKDGDKPVLLGIMAAFRKDMTRVASVKTDTQVEAEEVHMDSIKGQLRYDLPKDIQKDVETMTSVVTIGNSIQSLKAQIAQKERVNIDLPQDLHGDLAEILTQLSDLYNHTLGNI